MIRYIILIALFIPSFVMAQSAQTDSLEQRLKELKQAERIPVLLQLAESMRSSDPAASFNCGNEALQLISHFPDSDLELEARYQIGWARIYLRDYDSALVQASKIDSMATSIRDTEARAKAFLLKGRIARQKGRYDQGIAVLDSGLVLLTESANSLLRLQLLNEIGSVYRRQGNSQEALKNHMEALGLAENLGDKRSLSTTLGYIGIIHDIMGNYDEALKAHQQTMRLREELNDKRGVAASVTNLGILHQKINNYDEAMSFYERALKVWKELKREQEQAATYNNMGAVEDLLGNYEAALNYYRQALTIWEKLESTHSIAIALSNIGNIQAILGNYEEALVQMERAYDIRRSVGDRLGSASSLLDIAELYNKLGQVNLSLEAAHEALELAEQTGSWPMIRDVHEVLSEYYKNLEQYRTALEHFSQFKSANDSVFNIESSSVIAELQEAYKTTEQKQEIAALQQRDKMNNIWLGVLAGGISLIGIVMILLQSRYRMKNKAHDALEKLHEKEIEQAKLEKEKAEATANYLHLENERKSQELEAARELQLSMLPSSIPEVPFANISAMMETAVEVGGDYYDFDVSNDGFLTMVIGDATGHGVKAGTMVTATKSLFNHLSGREDLTEILTLGSAAIKKMKLPKLYMALALIRLNGGNLQLAGAGIPPALIYRAKSHTVEQVDLKGMPLGSAPGYPYQVETIQIEKDDVVLLYTDGLPEIFNPEGKMFGYVAVAELLLQCGDGSVNEIINHMKTAAMQWLGDGSQDDDITLIALKSSY